MISRTSMDGKLMTVDVYDTSNYTVNTDRCAFRNPGCGRVRRVWLSFCIYETYVCIPVPSGLLESIIDTSIRPYDFFHIKIYMFSWEMFQGSMINVEAHAAQYSCKMATTIIIKMILKSINFSCIETFNTICTFVGHATYNTHKLISALPEIVWCSGWT